MFNGVLLFIGFIVVLFALWLGGGVENRSISFAGPYLHPIATTATTAQAYGQSRSAGTPGVLGNFFGGSGTPNTGSTIGTSETIAAADTSPYHGVVTFGRDPSPARSKNVKEEFVDIRVDGRASGSVDLTGWKLVSDISKTSVRIPGGTETPRTGVVNTLSDIMVAPGSEAFVVSGASPIGVSFRENLCTGYFEQHQEFTPALPLMCPSAHAEYARTYPDNSDDSCSSYLYSVPSCQTAPDSQNGVPGSCTSFADSALTYNSCVSAHQSDANFSGTAWHIYLSSKTPLWNDDRDTIRLLDGDGKTVDVLSY